MGDDSERWTDEDVARRLEEAFREGFRTYPQTEGQEIPAWHNSKTKAFVDSLDADPAPSSVEREPEVGCEDDDGLLYVHPESETCEVCAPDAPQEDGGTPLAIRAAELLEWHATDIECQYDGDLPSLHRKATKASLDIADRLRRSEGGESDG